MCVATAGMAKFVNLTAGLCLYYSWENVVTLVLLVCYILPYYATSLFFRPYSYCVVYRLTAGFSHKLYLLNFTVQKCGLPLLGWPSLFSLLGGAFQFILNSQLDVQLLNIIAGNNVLVLGCYIFLTAGHRLLPYWATSLFLRPYSYCWYIGLLLGKSYY